LKGQEESRTWKREKTGKERKRDGPRLRKLGGKERYPWGGVCKRRLRREEALRGEVGVFEGGRKKKNQLKASGEGGRKNPKKGGAESGRKGGTQREGSEGMLKITKGKSKGEGVNSKKQGRHAERIRKK